MTQTIELKPGDFVRVKADSEFRPGQDGMVVEAGGGDSVGLVFGFDRHNQGPDETGIVRTGLTEEWFLYELDLATVAH